MQYLLVGNYGVANAGDEILQQYFLERYSEHTWLMVSANPQAGEYARFPTGIRSFFSFRWLRTLRALRRSDGMVFGGGSLFTDAESVWACIIWWVHGRAARLCRKPICLAFQGIGPFRTTLGERLARSVVSAADFISVRDKASADRIALWKKNTECVQSFDPSISLLEKQKTDSSSKNVFMYIPRFSTTKCHQSCTHLLSFLGAMGQHQRVVIVSLQPDHPEEAHVCRMVSDRYGLEVVPCTTLSDAVAVMQGATAVLTERYHGAVAALSCTVPFVAIRQREGDKLDHIAQFCSCPSVSPAELDAASVRDLDWNHLKQQVVRSRKEAEELVQKGEEALRSALL